MPAPRYVVAYRLPGPDQPHKISIECTCAQAAQMEVDYLRLDGYVALAVRTKSRPDHLAMWLDRREANKRAKQ